ncbi:MAG: methyltransferase domain-containing protein [Gammaproteobacteria bacterium]|nr:methyltransferase domain-containing protein [Gammaproteobacteria bacterium]NIR81747.1 methyltransferase domain-containing protein [Gammaproteobacteria bacterium]NIR88550.1 methyltransferase domain-containing protein [Gammaproteobacteria bacterium]NIU02854.1 methyltransferase domain-containing protein [Gammaproteobacteria bacterium]NIV50376.1 methyltransferase domain-containing protein [Gammaproteobacteria bacterium]
MTGRANHIDTTAAEAYERFMVPSLFGPWVPDVVELAALQVGEHVLDVACGTGIATRLAAERVTASGRVVGLDIDAGMVEVARLRSTQAATPIEWRCGDALDMPFEDGVFDAVLCLQGLQFFPDKTAGLGEILRVLKPAGRFAASLWRSIEHCKGHHVLVQVLERHGVDAAAARRPFSLGEADELRNLAGSAGFRQVSVRAVMKLVRFGSPQEFVENLAAGAPSTRHALAKLSEHERLGVIEEVSAGLQPYMDNEGIGLPYASHLLLAHP